MYHECHFTIHTPKSASTMVQANKLARPLLRHRRFSVTVSECSTFTTAAAAAATAADSNSVAAGGMYLGFIHQKANTFRVRLESGPNQRRPSFLCFGTQIFRTTIVFGSPETNKTRKHNQTNASNENGYIKTYVVRGVSIGPVAQKKSNRVDVTSGSGQNQHRVSILQSRFRRDISMGITDMFNRSETHHTAI